MKINYKDFVCKLHQTMLEQELLLIYEGEINQSITKAFTTLVQRNIERMGKNVMLKRKVFHIMIECLQNITRHRVSSVPGSDICLVGYENDAYFVITGNVMPNSEIDELNGLLTLVNSMNKEELNQLYKKQMIQSRISDKGGAGLGFIDMIRKTGSKLIFHFEPLNSKTSFFILKINIS